MADRRVLQEVVADLPWQVERIFCTSFQFSLAALHENLINQVRLARDCKAFALVDVGQYGVDACRYTAPWLRLHPVIVKCGGVGRSSFHPKVLLLVSDQSMSGHRKMWAAVGSANVTVAGLQGGNDECLLSTEEIDIPATGSSWSLALAAEVCRFLDSCLRRNRLRDPVLGQVLSLLGENCHEMGMFRCADTLSVSLVSQVRQFVHDLNLGKASRLVAVSSSLPSPEGVVVFDRVASALNAEGTPDKTLVTNQEATGIGVNGVFGAPAGWTTRITKDRRHLHAKLIVATYGKRSVLIQGSANLTAAAYLRTSSRGGNVEFITMTCGRTADLNQLVTAFLALPTGTVRLVPSEDLHTPDPFAAARYDTADKSLVLETWYIPARRFVIGHIELNCDDGPGRASRTTEVRLNRMASDTVINEYHCKHQLLKQGEDPMSATASITVRGIGLAENRIPLQIVHFDPSFDEHKSSDPWEIDAVYSSRPESPDGPGGDDGPYGPVSTQVSTDVWPLFDELSRRIIRLKRSIRDGRFDGATDDAPIYRRLGSIEKDGLKHIVATVDKVWNPPPQDSPILKTLQEELSREIRLIVKSLKRRGRSVKTPS